MGKPRTNWAPASIRCATCAASSGTGNWSLWPTAYWCDCAAKANWGGGQKKLRTLRQTIRALQDYLRQRFWLHWLPEHQEVFKEHTRQKGYCFSLEFAELTK